MEALEIELFDMAYKDDLDRLHKKIDSLAARPTPVPKNTLAVWGVIIAGASLVLAFFAFWSGHSDSDTQKTVTIEVTNQLKDPLKTLAEVAGDVRGIKEFLALDGFHAFLDLPSDQAGSVIPQLRKSMEFAKKSNVQIASHVLQQARLHLSQVSTSSPQYWSVAGELISYQSQLLKPGDKEPETECIPAGTIFTAMSGYRNCILDLDAPKLTASDITCTHCMVRYSGGTISIKKAHFIDCILAVREPQNGQVPSPVGQRFVQMLLEDDDLKNVFIEIH